MKTAMLLPMLFVLSGLGQLADVWKNVSLEPSQTQIESVNLTKGQLAQLKKTLVERMKVDRWCDETEDPDWVDGITAGRLPVSADGKSVLVEAGVGCARGGQGSNGAMWVVRFEGDKPIFLATPEHRFGGWLYSIESSKSHGFKDLVLGWHMSAGEADLSYFKFDGKMYRLVATAKWTDDEDGKRSIIPTRNVGNSKPNAQ